MIQFLGAAWVKLRNIKPIPTAETLDCGDTEDPDAGYPMVLVQIPMCNEREVCSQLLFFISIFMEIYVDGWIWMMRMICGDLFFFEVLQSTEGALQLACKFFNFSLDSIQGLNEANLQ